MTIFIETITARSDGRVVTKRVRARNLDAANRLAYVWSRGFQTVEDDCKCGMCPPLFENDYGEHVTIMVQEYSPEARVQEGLEIY